MCAHDALTAGRWLVCLRLRRRLRSVLDASRRRQLADRRFVQLLTDADRFGARLRVNHGGLRPSTKGTE